MWGPHRANLAKENVQLRQEVAELREWRRQAQGAFDKSYLHQMELSGEVSTTIRRSAQVSNKSYGMLKKMGAFEENFAGVTEDLKGIDGQICELTGTIATTSTAVQQTSAAVEQISASIAKIAEESTTRFHDIKNVAALSKSGQEEMVATLGVIQEITAGIDDLRAFLEIIDDIAGKTSILSMNAAIQAAHAGDVGKGFAVVADEIRRLAESSASNAAGITGKLNSLIGAIHQAEASSLKTSRILTEAEEKVAKASVGFQEIEQGARELSLGGREMLEGVGSLKQVADTLTDSASIITKNSNAIMRRVSHLQTDSQEIEASLTMVRDDSANLNTAGLTLTQTVVKQLGVSREFMNSGSSMDAAFASILTLQHLAWVTRVRGVLDGKFQLEASAVADHHQCDFGKWLDGNGKALLEAKGIYGAIYDQHEQMHLQAKQIVALFGTPGKQAEAEAAFPSLVNLSEAIVASIQKLAENTSQQRVLIPWLAEYELGIDSIDRQHRRLVDLINQLFSAMQMGRGRQSLEAVLVELVDYTKAHFSDEEKLFLASPYPGKEAHQEQHREFVATITRFTQDFSAGTLVMGSETLAFLKDWLLKHIKGTDRGYVKFVSR